MKPYVPVSCRSRFLGLVLRELLLLRVKVYLMPSLKPSLRPKKPLRTRLRVKIYPSLKPSLRPKTLPRTSWLLVTWMHLHLPLNREGMILVYQGVILEPSLSLWWCRILNPILSLWLYWILELNLSVLLLNFERRLQQILYSQSLFQ